MVRAVDSHNAVTKVWVFYFDFFILVAMDCDLVVVGCWI